MLAAVGGLEHDAGGGVCVRLRRAADGPAGVGVRELNRRQAAVDGRVLQLPIQAPVFGVPNDATVADGPTPQGIDEVDAGQLRIGLEGIGGGFAAANDEDER